MLEAALRRMWKRSRTRVTPEDEILEATPEANVDRLAHSLSSRNNIMRYYEGVGEAVADYCPRLPGAASLDAGRGDELGGHSARGAGVLGHERGTVRPNEFRDGRPALCHPQQRPHLGDRGREDCETRTHAELLARAGNTRRTLSGTWLPWWRLAGSIPAYRYADSSSKVDTSRSARFMLRIRA